MLAAGLPVPVVGELLEVGGRPGLLFERVAGISLTEAFRHRPWTLVATAKTLAELHATVHAHKLPELPSCRTRLAERIRSVDGLPENVREAVLLKLEALPDGDQLCHGDFHPDNILLTRRGPVIIDWADAARGCALADVARTSLLLTAAKLPPTMPGRRLIETIRHLVHRTYLRRYFQLHPEQQEDFTAWRLVVAAARLAEGIPEERPRLGAILRSGLVAKPKRSDS